MWAPHLKILVFTGSKQSRLIAEKLDFWLDLPNDLKIPAFNVCLCSYEMLRIEVKLLLKVEWQALVIDEGQRLKNNSSKIFKMAQALRCSFRVLLSGTPLQNNFDELYNLMEYVDPDKFGPKFRKDMELLRTTSLDANQATTVVGDNCNKE